MSRPSRVRAIALLALVAAAGCQDYNFNPVGHCMIQPGTRRVTLETATSADVLFVVDDSGSMGGEQQKLSANFSAFVDNLNQTNLDRVAVGQEPIDFHLAVTTTSVFHNEPVGASCRSDCPNASGTGPVCCTMSGTTPTGPLRTVQRCGPGITCQSGACRPDCRNFVGESVCCDETTLVPATTQEISCSAVGEPCGDLRTHYRFPGSCTAGSSTGQDQRPYPQGSFVGYSDRPRVIHFDKELYECDAPPCTENLQGYTSAELQDHFRQNVIVGTCGSGQEQALEAARRALQKASDERQFETMIRKDQPAPPNTPARWLQNRNSKLVLVFVGDEDDCSSEQDANRGIVLSGPPGADTCVADAAKPQDQQKQFSVESMVDSIVTLAAGRPLGAAFIVSARAAGQDVCEDATCVPDICCDTACTGSASVCTTNVCGGQARGSRLLKAAEQFRGRGADVVAGSICDPNFGQILNRVAEIVKPPSGLLLPTAPASEDVAVLRIARANGTTRKTCKGPAPAAMTSAEAAAGGYDWWFTATREQLTPEQQDPVAPSRFIYINHDTRNCEANSGETYSADYLGRLPANGCSGATAAEADASCVAQLGGRDGDWTCFNGTDAQDYCTIPTGGPVVGTCICGPRYIPPPAGASACTPAGGNCPWGCTPGDDYCPTREHAACP
jgi:hypothetical protein